MKIPDNAIIPSDKLTRYLLIPKARDDRSKFLAQAGFTQANPEALESALRLLAASVKAIEDRVNEYETFYLVKGEVIGSNNTRLPVVTIWLLRQIDGQVQFVTLKPNKEL